MDGGGGVNFMKMFGTKEEQFNRQPHTSPLHSPARRSRSNPTRLPNLDGGKFQGILSPTARYRGHPDSPSRFMDPSPMGETDYSDLRVGLPMINDNAFGLRAGDDEKKKRLPNRAKSFMPTSRTMAYDETPRIFNPDPVPYHSEIFKDLSAVSTEDNIRKHYGRDPLNKVRVVGRPLPKQGGGDDTKRHFLKNRSSTMIRKFPMPKRHGDMWGSNSSYERSSKNRGIVVHSSRYQWDDIFAGMDDLSQPERMALESEYIERLRSIRRQREVIPHRETLSFTMGGNKVELNERDDIMQELRHLKSIVLPTKARDLYVGRGFQLPENHALNKPRKKMSIAQIGGSSKAQSGKPQAAAPVAVPPASTADAARDGNWTKQVASPSPDQTHVDQSYIEGIADNGPESEMDIHVPEVGHDNAAKPDKHPTPKPSCPKLLKNLHTDSSLQEDELKSTFSSLSAEKQGKLQFEDIQSLLSIHSPGHEHYVQQVFQLVTEKTSFDEDDFVSLHYLCKNIANLQGAAKDSIDNMKKEDVTKSIQEFIDQFQFVDRQETGKISVESLSQILENQLHQDMSEAILTGVKSLVDPQSTGSVTKLDYISCVPYFISLVVK